MRQGAPPPLRQRAGPLLLIDPVHVAKHECLMTAAPQQLPGLWQGTYALKELFAYTYTASRVLLACSSRTQSIGKAACTPRESAFVQLGQIYWLHQYLVLSSAFFRLHARLQRSNDRLLVEGALACAAWTSRTRLRNRRTWLRPSPLPPGLSRCVVAKRKTLPCASACTISRPRPAATTECKLCLILVCNQVPSRQRHTGPVTASTLL